MVNVFSRLKSIFRNRKEQPLPFKSIFVYFRQALDKHNRAFEIIADMGDKLGGDYLFDINYINSAYTELYDNLSDSLTNFDILTGNRYSRLKDIFSRIDRAIRRLVYDDVSSFREFVIFYDDITWDMAHETGGKNANLAEVKNNLKLNVPDAFAVTTHAFSEFMRHNRIDERILASGGATGIAEPALNEIRSLIINGEIPPALAVSFDNALKRLGAGCKGNCYLAVRSSAEGEDGEFSFAGQFETVLNVPNERRELQEAYKRVIASLFSDKAAAYRRQTGDDIRNKKMAVGCLIMVDAASSGVIYSSNPNGDDDTLIINATWGLGKSIVEGQTDADFYTIKKSREPEIMDKKAGGKTSMIINRKEGGIRAVATPAERIEKECLTESQALALAAQAMQIEEYFRKPQDIEWAIDGDGKVFILQTRPLRVAAGDNTPSPPFSKGGYIPLFSKQGLGEVAASNAKIFTKTGGIIVQKGAGAGRVFVLKHMDELAAFPKGAVLVARNDSSDFIRIMPYASAIITDIGTPTSHMASLCREFRIPAVVNAGNATRMLKHGQEVTVNAEDDGTVTIYEGIVGEILDHAALNSMKMEDIYEFRKKRYVLRYISPLNLIDPLLDNFVPEGCKTMHDVLRFIHEKSVMELITRARYGLKRRDVVQLDLPVPAGIIVVDIGGGLNAAENHDKSKNKITFERISSIPFRATLKGMMHPGVWHSEAVALKAEDFLASMMRMPDIISDSDSYVRNNVAVISHEYVNLSLRFGYHFNMLDCFCSENARSNHLYFRFAGGATDISKRSRRVQFIAAVLKEYGFNLKIKGDLLIARLANIGSDEMQWILDRIGRLIAYTRQLDAVLHDDAAAERYTKNFLAENYEL